MFKIDVQKRIKMRFCERKKDFFLSQTHSWHSWCFGRLTMKLIGGLCQHALGFRGRWLRTAGADGAGAPWRTEAPALALCSPEPSSHLEKDKPVQPNKSNLPSFYSQLLCFLPDRPLVSVFRLKLTMCREIQPLDLPTAALLAQMFRHLSCGQV